MPNGKNKNLWPPYLKKRANFFLKKIGKKELFEISTLEKISRSPKLIYDIKSSWGWAKNHNSIVLGVPVLVACLLIILLFGEQTDAVDRWIEFWGLTFDVAIILIFVEFLRERRERKDRILRLHETIEDYKCWNSEEAGYRIAGAMRRLERLGETKFDLSGWKVQKFEFKSNGIRSIKGSTFYDGWWANFHKPSKASLQGVNFGWVDCEDVTFSNSDLRGMTRMALGTELKDCLFCAASLQNAKFDFAKLTWSNPPILEQYEEVGENSDGSPIIDQIVFSPFHQANIEGTSFKNVAFVNADFRDVENIDKAIFEGATGLETCLFDTEEDKQTVLKSAKLSVPNDNA